MKENNRELSDSMERGLMAVIMHVYLFTLLFYSSGFMKFYLTTL